MAESFCARLYELGHGAQHGPSRKNRPRRSGTKLLRVLRKRGSPSVATQFGPADTVPVSVIRNSGCGFPATTIVARSRSNKRPRRGRGQIPPIYFALRKKPRLPHAKPIRDARKWFRPMTSGARWQRLGPKWDDRFERQRAPWIELAAGLAAAPFLMASFWARRQSSPDST